MTKELLDKIQNGSKKALGKLITLIENNDSTISQILPHLFQFTKNCHIIGVTGPPGSGKSTLIAQMIKEYRDQHRTVGVVCIDPSSPYSGGAILGDRIRMQLHSLDEGVYIRSMGSRGSHGGVAATTTYVVWAIAASKKDVIIVETVGAGQDELEIMDQVHSILVLDIPGLGDDIQTIKAGLMEIADIFVVNKAELTGADVKVHQIASMINMRDYQNRWKPLVQKTIATQGQGISNLIKHLSDHLQYLKQNQILSRFPSKLTDKLLKYYIEDFFQKTLWNQIQESSSYNETHKAIREGRLDPYSAVQTLFKKFKESIQE